jgi:hypothetical protein
MKNLDSNVIKMFLSEPSPSVFFVNNGDVEYFSVSNLIISYKLSDSFKMYFESFVANGKSVE